MAHVRQRTLPTLLLQFLRSGESCAPFVRSDGRAWLLAWLFISFPFVYYFVFPHPRYRAPIEPEITILICYMISETKEFRRKELAA